MWELVMLMAIMGVVWFINNNHNPSSSMYMVIYTYIQEKKSKVMTSK
jgi:hypothetical protein